jgi:hypothetical protein
VYLKDKEFENLKLCNQLSNLNAGFTNLDGETLVKVIKPPIVHIDISGIMLDLDHVTNYSFTNKNHNEVGKN